MKIMQQRCDACMHLHFDFLPSHLSHLNTIVEISIICGVVQMVYLVGSVSVGGEPLDMADRLGVDVRPLRIQHKYRFVRLLIVIVCYADVAKQYTCNIYKQTTKKEIKSDIFSPIFCMAQLIANMVSDLVSGMFS